MKLAFGLNSAIPKEAKAAWGCRAIVKQTGEVDVLHDRQDLQGDDPVRQALVDWLNGGEVEARPYVVWQKRAAALLRNYSMGTREEHLHVLYEDKQGKIVGNTNASAGYLYVAAWLKGK